MIPVTVFVISDHARPRAVALSRGEAIDARDRLRQEGLNPWWVELETVLSGELCGRVLEDRVDAVAETVYALSRRGGAPWGKLPEDSLSSWEPNRNEFRQVARSALGLDEGEETPQ